MPYGDLRFSRADCRRRYEHWYIAMRHQVGGDRSIGYVGNMPMAVAARGQDSNIGPLALNKIAQHLAYILATDRNRTHS